MVIKKLKERVKSLSGNVKEENIKKELEEIKTITIELDHRVTKLIAENGHLKQTYKKLKGKVVVDDVVTSHLIDPELLKVDVAQLAPKLRNNRTVHSDYLKHTQEETATLREIFKQGRTLNPLNTSLDYASWKGSLVEDSMRVTFDCYKGPYDSSYAAPIFNERGSGQRPACYECGVQGHFKRECPKLKNNNNHGNQSRRNNAPARVYAVGRTRTDPDANVITGTFLLNNRYAFILFDTGADRSFVSTTFRTQINITPSTLDHCYDVNLADGRIIGLNTILRGCTLNLLKHPFNIDLMPVELGSFDAIIDMDWLAMYQAVIVCAEKIVRIPWGNETLIIHGDGSN
nr:putative reverse transcriptase domain-containing protein [Tanacetum cinerariifolium]